MADSEGAPALALRDVVVQFGRDNRLTGARRVTAVDGVDLEVRGGETVALVGESGCGKSTTAAAALGMVSVSSGSVCVSGAEVTTARGSRMKAIRRAAQLILQDPFGTLDPRFTVRRTVLEPLIAHKVGTKLERESLVVDALERVGLSPAVTFLERRPHELSGGQRQRVSIAAALVLEPRLLVADEPVSMLDVTLREEVLETFERLRRDGVAILMITHDLSVAETYADRVVVMYLGRIVEEGPTRAVLGNPSHPYTKALVSVLPDADPDVGYRPQLLTGDAPDAANVPRGCRFHPRCPAALASCRAVDPQLLSVGSDPAHRAACPVLTGM